MFKIASENLQRRHRLSEVRQPTGGYICEDDFTKKAEDMSLEDLESERAQLLRDKQRYENEISGAKKVGHLKEAASIGHKLQGLCSRLSQINQQMKKLRMQRGIDTFRQAAFEVLPQTLIQKIFDRELEIRRGAGSASVQEPTKKG